MKNPRKTLIYIFLIFHLIHFIGALYIDARQDDLGFLLSIKGYLPWMKYFALTGLILFLVAYIAVMRDTRLLRKSIDQAREEHTSLKAKLFDFQEASRKSDTPVSTTTSVEAPEKELEDKGEEDEAEAEDSDTNPK
jgi:hypothetical protein